MIKPFGVSVAADLFMDDERGSQNYVANGPDQGCTAPSRPRFPFARARGGNQCRERNVMKLLRLAQSPVQHQKGIVDAGLKDDVKCKRRPRRQKKERDADPGNRRVAPLRLLNDERRDGKRERADQPVTDGNEQRHRVGIVGHG